jgi:hypothetical protein
LHTGLGQLQLESAKLFRGRGVGGTAEEGRQPLDGTDLLALRVGHEPVHAHVFKHALARRADEILAHGVSCLEVGVLDPSIFKAERPPVTRAIKWLLR